MVEDKMRRIIKESLKRRASSIIEEVRQSNPQIMVLSNFLTEKDLEELRSLIMSSIVLMRLDVQSRLN